MKPGNASSDATGQAREPSRYITNELDFLIPLLARYPKCYWIWNHRIWILQHATDVLAATAALRLWEEELRLVGKMLNRDSRNFHAWDYRRMVVQEVGLRKAATEIQRDGEGKTESLAEVEYAYSTKMIMANLSNFSAWHYRSKLLPRLLDERQASSADRRKILDAEFILIQKALYTDPYDQSLWFYHQYLMANITTSAARKEGLVVPDLDPSECAMRIAREFANLEELLEDASNCKWIYAALLQYSVAVLALKTNATAADQLQHWLAQLRHLDPLREGRWRDLAASLGI